MATTAELDAQLNGMILTGKAIEGFDQFYASNVVMQEASGEKFEGKALNRERELKFFSTIEQLHALELKSSAVEGDRSFSEWVLDVTFQGGTRYKLEQVAVRQWADGQIVHERFYYKG